MAILKKKTIQFAQNYFAIQTRKQELHEDNKKIIERIEARKKLAETEKKLSGIVYQRGFTDRDFGTLRSKGDEALFGGKNTQKMKDKLNVPTGRPLADFADTVIIKAKDLAAEVTSHNVIKQNLQDVRPITDQHIVNNTEVRKYLIDRGITPEELPPLEDIKKVERKLNKKIELKEKKQEEISTKQEVKINISTDLWKYALLIIYTKKDKQILTKDLKEDLLKIKGLIPEEYKKVNPTKNEPYYYQIIRNLKSNKKNKTNPINQGYCEDIKGGFKITDKGVNFIKEYFSKLFSQ